MRPLHICFISQEYPPDTGWGGIGSYTYEMAHGLVRAGHQVSVIARALGPEKVVVDKGVVVHRIAPSPDWGRLRGVWRLNSIWPGFAWAVMVRLRRIQASAPIDLVEAGEGRADSFFVSFLRKKPPVIVRLHTAWIFVDRLNAILPDRKKRFIYWLEKQAILRSAAVTAPSRAVVRLTRTWVPIPGRRVSVVPNPVDAKNFSPGPACQIQEVLFVGRLERNKGLETLVTAVPKVLQHCPAAFFRFVGSDSQDAHGQSWREQLTASIPAGQRSRIHFEQVPRTDLVQRYRRAALCVLPSLWENFPYAVLEAMACGIPVVATRTGGLPELVEDGVSGLLIPPEDPDALAAAICSLLADAARREEMGHNARSRVEALFSVQKVVPAMLNIYQSVLSRTTS